MSNSISLIPNLPQELVQHILLFNNPPNPARARVNCEFRGIHTDFLRQNIRQIFERCSTGPAALNLFINSLKERCRIAELQDDYSHFDSAGVNHLHQLIVQKIQSFGIACPNTYLSPQEIRRYAAAVEDLNLQRAWGGIRYAITAPTFAGVPPLNLPEGYASAAAIRTWMNGNVAALQSISILNLSNRQLTYIPREIALLTGLRWLCLDNNQIRELPVGIFSGLVGLERLCLNNNQISELPAEAFNGLVQLQHLYLNNNQISELPVGIFNGSVWLQELYLHYNQIRELPIEIFNGLVQLQHLYLNNNQISELPVGIFNGLVWLQELCLHYNQIRELPVEIFNGLVQLQNLYLSNNQISELPAGTFNGLEWLHELGLHGNPQLLVFYKELQPQDFSSDKDTFERFHQYACRSAFARFYQFAAQGHAFGNVIDAFHDLDQTTKNGIYGMIYEEAGWPTTDDSRWGEHHAFNDKGIFNGALKRYVRGQFNALSESQKNVVYECVRELGQADQSVIHEDFSDPDGGRNYAKNNVLRLIDAMILAREVSLDRKRDAIVRLNQIISLGDQQIAGFEPNPAILTFDLDLILQDFDSNHLPSRFCGGLLSWAGVRQDKSDQFTHAVQHYNQGSNEHGILVQTLLSKMFSFFNQKRNQPGQSQNVFKAQFREVVDKIIDADSSCMDQMLSQLQEMIFDLVAAIEGKNNILRRIQFGVSHALAQYRSHLLKQICVRQNPDENSAATLERLVMKRLTRDLGLRGAIFEAGARYESIIDNVDMKVQCAMDAFRDEYKPLLFLVNELGSVHSNCRKLRTDMIQWADQRYALSDEKESDVKDTDMNRLLSADYDAGLTAPFNYGGAWAPATALLLLEAAGLIHSTSQ